MHPIEVWWLIDAKKPPKRLGRLNEHEVDEILADLADMGVKVPHG